MRISWQWVLSLLDLGDVAAPSPRQIAEILTSVGLEVEGITEVGAGLDRLVVGEVREKTRHPNADRLTVVGVFAGDRLVNVVCGAPNVPEVGGKVAFAPVGTRLPGGMEIGAREVRGVHSEGMLCSEDELEIGADDGGILVLPTEWAAGDRLVDRVPEIVDAIIEIGVTPNRPDALGHVGVARDVAVKLGVPLRLPEVHAPRAPLLADLVTMAAPARCGRYFGYAIDGVTVGPSPLGMRVRLQRLGLRAINNCVDITNFVLLEQGQPLHAFDRDRLGEGRVVVRMAAEGEAFTALDGAKLELVAGDLVIADAKAPQALAGVMGGAGSMVHAGTTALLLEAAWFEPRGIRASARRHGMSTDSSYRFERGVDHGPGLERAALRALGLFIALAGGACVGQAEVVGERPPPPRIALRLARVEHLLGMPVGAEECRRILIGLGVDVGASDHAGVWSCAAPSHRPDLQREVDLIEEIMRFHGLEDLPARATVPSAAIAPHVDPRAELRDRLVDALREAGVHEHVSYAFTAPDKLRPFLAAGEEASIVAVHNPLRTPLSVMRTHLLPGLLDALEINVARHGHAVRLFEVGRTYAWADGPARRSIDRSRAAAIPEIDGLLPVEREWVAILLFGTGESEGPRAAVGALVHALARLGYAVRVDPRGDDGDHADGALAPIAYLHPGVQAALRVDTDAGPRTVGYVGELHPDALIGRELATGARVHVGAINLDALPPPPIPVARERPRFPATSRDLSLEIPCTVAAALVVDALTAAAAALAEASAGEVDPPRLAGDGVREGVEVVEDYRGAGVPDDHRALLLRLHYRAHGRTVTDDEVQALHAALVLRATESLRPRAPAIRVR